MYLDETEDKWQSGKILTFLSQCQNRSSIYPSAWIMKSELAKYVKLSENIRIITCMTE